MRSFNNTLVGIAIVLASVASSVLTNDPFSKLTGDVVIIHGWGGSKLVDTTKNNKVYWVTEELVNNQVHPPMHLPISSWDDTPNNVVNNGYLESKSYLAYYTPFLNAIQHAAQASSGRFTVHLFDYDFRRNNVVTTEKFVSFIQNIYNTNGKKKVIVIAHSMGGIITLAAIHQKPNFFRGIVFAGTPFNGSITALHDKLEGSPVGNNTKVFSAETHFQLQSSFCFFPFDGSGLLYANGSEFKIDYFNPTSWVENKLSATLRTTRSLSIGTYHERIVYVFNVVSRAAQMKYQMYSRPLFPYPKIAVLAGNRIPTVYRYPATKNSDGSLNVDFINAVNMPGDGLISLPSAHPPSGIPYNMVYTDNDHMTLLNDLAAVSQAISIVA